MLNNPSSISEVVKAEKRSVCSICLRAYRSEEVLQRHQATVHAHSQSYSRRSSKTSSEASDDLNQGIIFGLSSKEMNRFVEDKKYLSSR